jgi:hypothetical protein
MRRAVLIVFVLATAATAGIWLALRERDPGREFSPIEPPPKLALSLGALPQVNKVQYTGPATASAIIIHLRDWHFVPRELCELDGIDFEANLATVAKVQEDELAIARFLIRDHGLKEIYSEGLALESVKDLQLRLDVLKDLDRLEELGGLDDAARRHKRELTLEVGIPGRLLRMGEIQKVEPVEDSKAQTEAGPFPSEGTLNARRKAIVARLPATGTALIVLGGAHDLGPHLGSDVLYVQVTPRSYPQ